MFQPENKDHYSIYWILTGKDNLFYGSGTAVETFEKFEIIPSSLSMQTGLPDKHGKMIFGSIEVDGVMSKGGDRIEFSNDMGEIFQDDVYYESDSACWYAGNFPLYNPDDIEIIGSQYEEGV